MKSAGDRFGDAIAVGSEVVVVGATGEDSCSRGIEGEPDQATCQEAGAAFVFRPTDGAWLPVMRLQTPEDEETTPPNHHGFGGALSLDGDTVVVGSPGAATITIFE